MALVTLALLIVVAAWTLPLQWVALILVALIPLQFYLTLPDSSITVRGAAVFGFVSAIRIFAKRFQWQSWMLPTAIFLLAALVAAMGASNRYLALKGIYDWLPVFAALFVVSQVAESAHIRKTLVIVLIAEGVGEALLGLLQYVLGLNTVLGVLRLPISDLFYQPNLLRERLSDLSFNWVIFDRAAPFGTFINGIDYAVFLAAILSLVLGLLLTSDGVIARRHRSVAEIPANRTQSAQSSPMSCRADVKRKIASGTNRPRNDSWKVVALLTCALILAGALLLTFKGSGLLALAGGAATVVLLTSMKSFRVTLSGRTLALGLVVLIGAVILAMPFADLIGQRVAFLIQREQGLSGTTGRLAIWASLMESFTTRPIFGYGLNNGVGLAEPTRTLSGGALAFISTTPESAYLAALIEVGAVGFIALMSLFIATFGRGYSQVRENGGPLTIGILAALVAILTGNLTVAGFTTDQNGMLLGVLMGLIWSKWNPR